MEKHPKIVDINGALVAFYPIDGLKAVAIDFQIRGGSWYEAGNWWGKAHLLEHMMFQGTQNFKNHDAMEVFKEENGIYTNARTSGSCIEAYGRMPSESFVKGMDLFNEMLFKLKISDEALNKQKRVVKQEFEDRISRPTARFWEKGMKQYFGEGHIYTRDGIGKRECFENATKEDLLTYMKKVVVPANMVISIAGKFDISEAEVVLRKMLTFGGKRMNLKTGPIKTNYERLAHFEHSMSSATVQIGYKTVGLDKVTFEDRVKIGLGSYLLGGGGRSVLYKVIREALGLAYSISSSIDYYPNVGWFEINTAVKKENVEMVIGEIDKSLNKFVLEKIDSETFARSKKYLVMQREMAYESAMGTASSMASSLFWYGSVVSPEEYALVVEKVTEAEVREVIKEIIYKKKAAIAVMSS
ncbi:hypothetical protein A2572_01730 [Candidatus Collierbacteria bacterium RIFOXYD1_FULL_40_9]|uniref:Peptidase M16 N-terminal domain-containing protein n=1 Tax=Candidatus Collierbacteria bacterium RIFOXYD1_FULL_40_9 TaxID=1817731 RepID=A0A1F5FUE5_9BACT|nr:MAG: hypothetical protein A2572_01730 [Candidatus Collierbacteria bacterium RIFOXYD1_FULL_40_9]